MHVEIVVLGFLCRSLMIKIRKFSAELLILNGGLFAESLFYECLEKNWCFIDLPTDLFYD